MTRTRELDPQWATLRAVQQSQKQVGYSDEARAHHVLDGVSAGGDDLVIGEDERKLAARYVERVALNDDDLSDLLQAFGLADYKEAPDTPQLVVASTHAAKPERQPRVVYDGLDWNWQNRALCRGEDVNLFFNVDGERGLEKVHREAKARQICNACPVTTECVDFATRTFQVGIWGGVDEEQRKAERRRQLRRENAA